MKSFKILYIVSVSIFVYCSSHLREIRF